MEVKYYNNLKHPPYIQIVCKALLKPHPLIHPLPPLLLYLHHNNHKYNNKLKYYHLNLNKVFKLILELVNMININQINFRNYK